MSAKKQDLASIMASMTQQGRENPARDAQPAPQAQVEQLEGVQVLPAPERPVRVPVAAREVRTGWGTRLRPSLKAYLKGQSVELSAEAGHNISMEDITETLLILMRDDAELHERVRAELLKG